MVPSDIPRRPRIRPATPPFGRNSNSSRSGSKPGDDDDTSELLLLLASDDDDDDCLWCIILRMNGTSYPDNSTVSRIIDLHMANCPIFGIMTVYFESESWIAHSCV